MPRPAAVIGSLLLLAATSPPAVAGGEPAGGIAELLDRRAEAMRRGDRTGFLATVAPDDPAFARRQRRLFNGFQRLGLAEYRLELGAVWPDLATDRERSRYPGEVRVLHVEEHARVRGYDPEAAVEDLYLTFVRRDGTWLVASDSDLDDVGLMSARRLWELGPIVTRSSEHFLYVSHPALATSAGPVLRAAEAALPPVVEGWPFGWERRVMILAPRSGPELARMIQATFDLDVFVAFATSNVHRDEDWNLVGHRIVLNWPNFSRHASGTQERILTHELLHVATREDAGPHVPIFVDEGVAEWVTGGRSTASLSARAEEGWNRRLPLDHEFTSTENREVLLAYEKATSAIGYAAERYGRRAVAVFYRRLGAVRREPGTWRYHVDRAMRGAFGVGYRRFEREWARSVEDG